MFLYVPAHIEYYLPVTIQLFIECRIDTNSMLAHITYCIYIYICTTLIKIRILKLPYVLWSTIDF